LFSSQITENKNEKSKNPARSRCAIEGPW